MFPEPVLVDTGPLIAIYSASDRHHESCTQQAATLPVGKTFTCWPVITEAAYLLRRHPKEQQHLLQRVEVGDLIVLPLGPNDVPAIRQILTTYDDQEIDLADACLFHLAAREGIRSVFTTDRRHFSVLRLPDGGTLAMLPS